NPAGNLVHRHLRAGICRTRADLQLLRVAVLVLGERPGRAAGLSGDHRLLRPLHEPARPGVRRRGRRRLMSAATQSNRAFRAQLKKVYGFYTGGFAFFVIALAILEQMGLPRQTIGYVFLIATVLLYAGIGIISRTNEAAEYYVAGRRVPAMFNGM